MRTHVSSSPLVKKSPGGSGRRAARSGPSSRDDGPCNDDGLYQLPASIPVPAAERAVHSAPKRSRPCPVVSPVFLSPT